MTQVRLESDQYQFCFHRNIKDCNQSPPKFTLTQQNFSDLSQMAILFILSLGS